MNISKGIDIAEGMNIPKEIDIAEGMNIPKEIDIPEEIDISKKIDKKNLIQAALDARENAYAPYSHYRVGAALLAVDGTIITGANIENASYGASNCAERTAVFKAVSEGRRSFRAIAVAGGLEGETPADYAYPCGICRQVMNEFAAEDFLVIVAKSTSDYKEYRLKQLLPLSFGGESIK